MQTAQQKLESGASILSDAARGQLEKDIDRMQTEMQRFSDDAQKEVQDLQTELQGEFQQKLGPVIQAVATEKKIDMLYAVDTKGDSWKTFQTTTMPTNFLIDKGGKIIAVAAGCDPSGLIAKKLSTKVAETVSATPVDVKSKVDSAKNQK